MLVLLLLCLLWRVIAPLKEYEVRLGLSMNADIAVCLGGHLNLICRHNVFDPTAIVEIRHVPEKFVPRGHKHEEENRLRNLEMDYQPGVPSKLLLASLRKHGIMVANGTLEPINSSATPYGFFNLSIDPITEESLGVYFCLVDFPDYPKVYCYTEVTLHSNCSVPLFVYFIGGLIGMGILVYLALLLCYMKQRKMATIRIITVTHLSKNLNTPFDPFSKLSTKPIDQPVVEFRSIRKPLTFYTFLVATMKRPCYPKTKPSKRISRRQPMRYGPPMATSDVRFAKLYRLSRDEDYELPKENLSFGRVLGSGAFGVVRSAFARGLPDHSEKPIQVAVKTLKDDFTESDVIDLLKEIDIMKQLQSHRHVIRLLAVCTQHGVPCLVMEYAPHGNLRTFLQTRKLTLLRSPTTAACLLNYGRQVAEGMEYLSSKSIIHRDLAARNILVGDDYVLKISDFGLTRSVDNYYRKQTDGRVPVKWLAPESIFDRIYTTMSDVWSFGVLLWEVFTFGGSPFKGIDPAAIPALVRMGKRNPKPQHANHSTYNLMLICWNWEPTDRPSFSDLARRLTDLESDAAVTKQPITEHIAEIRSPPEMADYRYTPLLFLSPQQQEKNAERTAKIGNENVSSTQSPTGQYCILNEVLDTSSSK